MNKQSLLSVYYAYIQANINYATSIWGNEGDIERVLKLQKLSIRILNNLCKHQSAKIYFAKDRIMTVISLFIYNSLLEMHKDNLQHKKDIHRYNKRNNEQLCMPKSRTKRLYKQGNSIIVNLFIRPTAYRYNLFIREGF